jgi:hypothetical protein
MSPALCTQTALSSRRAGAVSVKEALPRPDGYFRISDGHRLDGAGSCNGWVGRPAGAHPKPAGTQQAGAGRPPKAVAALTFAVPTEMIEPREMTMAGELRRHGGDA